MLETRMLALGLKLKLYNVLSCAPLLNQLFACLISQTKMTFHTVFCVVLVDPTENTHSSIGEPTFHASNVD